MELKDIPKRMLKDYFVIVTGVFFCEIIFCFLFFPEAVFTVKELCYPLIGGVLFSLPTLVFYSSAEISKKQWLCRYILHLVVLEVTVISAAHFLFGWLEGNDFMQHFVLVIMILLVYLIVLLVGWRNDLQVAVQINHKLQELKDKEEMEDVGNT